VGGGGVEIPSNAPLFFENQYYDRIGKDTLENYQKLLEN